MLPLRSMTITVTSSLLRVAPPLIPCIGILPRGDCPLVISLIIKGQAPMFRTSACITFMPPLHRLPLGPQTGNYRTYPDSPFRLRF